MAITKELSDYLKSKRYKSVLFSTEFCQDLVLYYNVREQGNKVSIPWSTVTTFFCESLLSYHIESVVYFSYVQLYCYLLKTIH